MVDHHGCDLQNLMQDCHSGAIRVGEHSMEVGLLMKVLHEWH